MILITLGVLILVMGIGLVIFLKTFDVNRYKPQIIAAAQKALGRKVDFKQMTLNASFKKGIWFKVDQLTMSDDPDFANEHFLKVEEVSCGIDALAYLISRQIALSKIEIKSPKITIIRHEDGSFNIQTIGKPGPSTGDSSDDKFSNSNPPQQNSVRFAPSPTKTSALPLIFIDDIVLEGGTVDLIDQSVALKEPLEVSQIVFKAQRFSLNKLFSFSLEAFLGDQQNKFLSDGEIQIDPRSQQIRVRDTKIQMDLTASLWDRVNGILNAQAKDVPWPETLNGRFQFYVKDLVAGPQGLGAVHLDLDLAGGRIVMKEVAPGISVDASQVDCNVSNFSLNGQPFQFDLQAAAFAQERNFSAQGSARFDAAARNVELSDTKIAVDLEHLPLQQLQTSFTLFKQIPFLNTLSGNLELTIKDFKSGPNGLDILSDLEWKEGAIKIRDLTPGVAIAASQIDLKLSDFSLKGNPFKIQLQAAVFADQPNVSLEGAANYDPQTQSIQLRDTTIVSDLWLLPLERLKSSLAVLKGKPFPDLLKGKLQLKLRELVVSPKGLGPMVFDAEFSNGEINVKEVAPGISVNATHLDVQLRDFSLLGDPFSFTLKGAVFGGEPNLSVEGTGKLNLADQNIHLEDVQIESNLSQLPLQNIHDALPVLKNSPWPQRLDGKLFVDVKDFAMSPQGIDELSLNSQITDGAVVIKDVVAGVTLDASQLELQVKDFSLGNDPFALTLKGVLWGAEQNFSLESSAKFDLAAKSVHLHDAVCSVDFSKVSLEALKASVAQVKDVPLPEILEGKFEAKIRDLSAGAKGLETLKLDAQLTHGKIRIKNPATGVALDASQIDFKFFDVSFQDPFQFTGTLAVFGNEPNVSLTGQGQIDASDQIVRFKDSSVQVDCARLSLAKIYAALNISETAALLENLQGQLNLTFAQLEATAKGLTSLDLKGELTDGHAALPQILLPLESVHALFAATATRFNLEDFSAKIAEGTIKAMGAVDDYLGTGASAQRFNAQLDVKGLALEKLIDQKKQLIQLQGTLNGQYSVKGQGFDPRKILDALQGEGQLEVADGRLTDINILKEVLDKLSLFPNLVAQIEASLPDQYKQKLTQKDTTLNKAQLQTKIAGGSIVIEPLDVDADGFLLNGQGNVGFDQAVALNTLFLIPVDLSANMVAIVPQLNLLFNDEQQITFPVKWTGKYPDIKPSVDLEYLIKKGINNEIKGEIQKGVKQLIGKYIKIEDQSSPPENNQGGTESPAQENPDQQNQESPAEKLLGNILDKVFK